MSGLEALPSFERVVPWMEAHQANVECDSTPSGWVGGSNDCLSVGLMASCDPNLTSATSNWTPET